MIDSHHHIWRQADLPWLLGPERPRIFGPYAAIKRNYPVEEYRSDIRGIGIKKSVYVQANWAPNWFKDEIAWVQSVADRSGWPHAIVGFLDFTKGDVGPALKSLGDFPLLRGFRQQFHWHENPLYRFAPDRRQVADPRVAENIGRLAEHGFTFDLQVFPGQMADAAELADACPDVTFILQHAGMLEDRSQAGWKAWRAAMTDLAKRKNVVTKLSAFGTFIRRNDPDFIADIVKQTVSIFGADRCMFGSNFPIEKLWTNYRDLVGAFRKATASLTKTQRVQIFNDTAARVYRVE
ncbi:MAG: amidohydrolase family protein [Boseongicola sp.]|nr:amidohydrolase family protein [Boseongicola sp.]